MKLYKFFICACFVTQSHSEFAMSWEIEDISFHLLYSDNSETELALGISEKLRCSLNNEERNKLEFRNGKYWYLSGKTLPEKSDAVQYAQLKYAKNEAKIISVKNAFNLIKNARVIFYTGAGISAAVVPDMQKLESQLGIVDSNCQDSRFYIKFANNIIKSPEKYIKIADDFFKACKNTCPTLAHIAIAEVAKSPVLTENLDQLHQKTGTRVITRLEFGKDEVKKLLNEAQYLIVIGMSADQSGLLKNYKALNPNGSIIAFTLDKNLEYLGKQDYMVIGDVQKTIPELKQLYITL